MAIYVSKDGTLRLYDGTLQSPFFLEIFFTEGNFSAPEGRARPEELLILNRGKIDANAHYIDGPDDVILNPLELTFSILLDEAKNKTKLRQAFNLDHLSTWLVGSNTWLTTKATSSVLSGAAVSVTTPAFADARKRTVDVEMLWADPDGAGNIGRKYAETYFPAERVTITESEDGVRVAATGLVYGAVSEITAFTTGIAS